MIRYGIIGTGWITDTFIGGAMKTAELSLSAVYSRSEEKGREFAEKHRAAAHGEEIAVFTDLEEMAKSDLLDGVYIASPNSLHYPQSKLFLNHNKHVICEKPITLWTEQLKELQDLAKTRGLVYMEAIMMMHQPQLKALKEAIGKIGRIYTARFDFSQLSSKYPLYMAGQLPNILNPAFGTGTLMDLGIYCIYLAVELFGKPEKMSIHSQFIDSGADISDEVVFSYPDRHVTITLSKAGQSRAGSEIIGDAGTVTIDLASQLTDINLHFPDGSMEAVWGEDTKIVLMGREAADFYRWIVEGTDEWYEQCSERAMEVCKILEELRPMAGIEFTGEAVKPLKGGANAL